MTTQSISKPSEVPNLDLPSLWYQVSDVFFYFGFPGILPFLGGQTSLSPLSLSVLKPDGLGGGTVRHSSELFLPVKDILHEQNGHSANLLVAQRCLNFEVHLQMGLPTRSVLVE